MFGHFPPRISTRHLLLIFVLLLALAAATYRFLDPEIGVLMNLQGRKTRAQRLAEFRAPAAARLLPSFEAHGVSYPPARVTLLALKEERLIELYAANPDGAMKGIKTYPIRGISGAPGPKLSEGDLQVPEGVYHIEALNPNSAFHVSMKLDYPNDFDLEMARSEGRTRLGRDIFIHGGASSVGCLAIGDPEIEELFLLAADTGLDAVQVIIAPCDLRSRARPSNIAPAWVKGLYDRLSEEMAQLKISH